jgi:hypothetical protein
MQKKLEIKVRWAKITTAKINQLVDEAKSIKRDEVKAIGWDREKVFENYKRTVVEN